MRLLSLFGATMVTLQRPVERVVRGGADVNVRGVRFRIR
jgi:hypothetical protein